MTIERLCWNKGKKKVRVNKGGASFHNRDSKLQQAKAGHLDTCINIEHHI